MSFVDEKKANQTNSVSAATHAFVCDSTSSFEEFAAYFQRIIESMPGFVYWVDTDMRLIASNRRVLELLGVEDLSTVVGQTLASLGRGAGWSSSVINGLVHNTEAVIKTRNALIGLEEPAIIDESGQEAHFLTSRIPIINSNDVVGVLGISVDITQQKSLEASLIQSKQRAEAMNRLKTEFIANMSHDIRTPISSIIGLSDILIRQPPTSQSSLLLEQINASSKELFTIVNEVLDRTSIEAHFVDRTEMPISIRHILDRLKTVHQPVALEKGLQLHFELDPDLPELIVVDGFSLHRVLMNIISNALKYTDEGSVSCSVKKKLDCDRKPELCMSVTDTGHGIAPTSISSIFEPFSGSSAQAEVSNPTSSGLGLYLVKKMVDKMGGQITLRSELNKGSRFEILLPYGLSNEVPTAMTAPATTLTQLKSDQLDPSPKCINSLPHSNRKCLVVEDNFSAQLVAKALLGSLGWSVTIASDGQSALSSILKESYDLIFMDIGLPDITGKEVSHLIRSSRQSESQWSPIIGLTAHADAQEKKDCLSYGVNFVLSKPITREKCELVMSLFDLL